MMIQCPACPARLQPLRSASDYASSAWDHAKDVGVIDMIPANGPPALVFLALVSHAMVVHDELDLRAYLSAYLNA